MQANELSKSEISGQGEVIPISCLRQSRYQVRDDAFESFIALKELAESIKALGLLELPKVRRCEDDPSSFEIISGHRRIKAASEYLGWKEIRCLVCEDVNEVTAFRMCATENIHRNNLSPYEEGIAYLLCQRLFGLSDDQLVELFSKGRARIVSRREIAKSANQYLKYVPNSDRGRFLQNYTLNHLEILRKLQSNDAIASTTRMIANGVSSRNLQRYIGFMDYEQEPRFVKSRQLHYDSSSKDDALDEVGATNRQVHDRLHLNQHYSFAGERITREDLLRFLYDVKLGTHIVLLYEDPSFGEVFSSFYLLQGLIKGEDAVYVTQEDEDKTRHMLVRYGIDTKHYEIERRLLHIRKVANPMQHVKSFEVGLREMYNDIFRDVKRPCRVVGTSIPRIDTEKERKTVIDLERRAQSAFEGEISDSSLFDVFRNFKGSAMCRYRVDRDKWSSYVGWIKNITSSHHSSIFLAEQEENPIILNRRN